MVLVDGRVLADGRDIPRARAREIVAATGAAESRRVREIGPELVYGCNMTVRRSVLARARFDERLPLYGYMEDRDFAFECMRVGRASPVAKAPCSSTCARRRPDLSAPLWLFADNESSLSLAQRQLPVVAERRLAGFLAASHQHRHGAGARPESQPAWPARRQLPSVFQHLAWAHRPRGHHSAVTPFLLGHRKQALDARTREKAGHFRRRPSRPAPCARAHGLRGRPGGWRSQSRRVPHPSGQQA